MTFVVGHGTLQNEDTFVPVGSSVHFYTEPGTDLIFQYGLKVLSDSNTGAATSHFVASDNPAPIPNLALQTYTEEEIHILVQAAGDDNYVAGYNIGGYDAPLFLCDGEIGVTEGGVATCNGSAENHSCTGVLGQLEGELYLVCCLGREGSDSEAFAPEEFLQELEEIIRLVLEYIERDPAYAMTLIDSLPPNDQAMLMSMPPFYNFAVARHGYEALAEGEFIYLQYYYTGGYVVQVACEKEKELREAREKAEARAESARYDPRQLAIFCDECSAADYRALEGYLGIR